MQDNYYVHVCSLVFKCFDQGVVYTRLPGFDLDLFYTSQGLEHVQTVHVLHVCVYFGYVELRKRLSHAVGV